MTAIHRRPPADTPSGWMPPSELAVIGSDPAPAQADWAVVGAGFTGLAAARRLAELNPDKRVVLIDAMPVGWGASGRNAGFVIDLPHKFDLDGDDAGRMRRVVRLNRAALADLQRQVEAGAIDCDWSPVGKLQAAIADTGLKGMRTFARILDSLDEPYRLLSREDLHRITGTRHYAGAIHTPGCVLMNPARLVRGLARTLPANVTVLDGCPVSAIAAEGSSHLISLRRRGVPIRIRAGRVIAAMNAYTSEFGWLRDRMVPIATFASLSAPLDDAQMAIFGGQTDWGLTPADAGGTTLRMTRDRRLLVRNRFDYLGAFGASDRTLDRVRDSHRLALRRRWPELADLAFESTWGGVCALSRNRVSYFGQMAPGVWGSNTHNGVGVARGTISGRLLAEAACGHDSDLLADMQAVSGQPVRNPPRPFVGLGVKTRLRYEAWKSRKEI
ncbi:NAD(P)/FAD-dependent oxidoreductase [Halovulum marinum]|nr:FAD-dependent oxidoreductase [Halovulum marinum]